MKTLLRRKVTEKSSRKTPIVFYLEQVYLNQEQTSPSSHFTDNFQYYFDFYYYKNNLPYEKPLLTVEVPLHKKKKITNTFSDSNYIFEYEIIPAGIKAHNNHMQARRSMSFNITLLADRILLPFLSGDTPDKPEYDYRLIEVSFPLQPNVHLTYISSFPCPQKMPNYPWAITPTPWNFMQTAVIPLTFIYPNLHEEGSE